MKKNSLLQCSNLSIFNPQPPPLGRAGVGLSISPGVSIFPRLGIRIGAGGTNSLNVVAVEVIVVLAGPFGVDGDAADGDEAGSDAVRTSHHGQGFGYGRFVRAGAQRSADNRGHKEKR